MTKLLPSLTLAAALTTISFAASADPISTTSPIMAFPKRCNPGSQVSCSCGDGGSGTATCNSSGIGISACACAKVKVDVQVSVPTPIVPVVVVPAVRVQRARVRRKKSPPSNGLGLLIGGACTLGSGAITLAFGVDRIRDYGKDPLGIVATSLGGTAMLVGLPLTIVGIVKYATFPKPPEKEKETKDAKDTGYRFEPTANGFAIRF